MRLTEEQVFEIACNTSLDSMLNYHDVLKQAVRNGFNRILCDNGGKIDCHFHIPTADGFGLSYFEQDFIVGVELDDDGVITIYTDGVPEIPLDMFYIDQQLDILERLMKENYD